MRKALLLCLVVVALLVMASAAFAGDTIGVTVTLQSVGVSVSPATWPIGIIAPNTTTAGYPVVATNTGNVAEDFTIATSNSVSWTAGAAAAANVFVIKADALVLTTSPQSLATNVATPSGTKSFNLIFTSPLAGSIVTAGESFTVTVAATAHS
jgi:hypothetical protein